MGSVVNLCKKAALETLDIWGLSEKLVTGEPVAQALDIWDNGSLKDMALTFGVTNISKLQLLENESERIEQALATIQGRTVLREVASQWKQIAEPLRILQPAALFILSKAPLKVDHYLSLGLLGTIGMMQAVPSGAGMLQEIAGTMGFVSNEAAVVMWEVAGLIADGDEAGIHVVERCIRADPHLSQCLDKALDWLRIKYAAQENTIGNEFSSPEGLIRIIAEMITNVLASETDSGIPRFGNS